MNQGLLSRALRERGLTYAGLVSHLFNIDCNAIISGGTPVTGITWYKRSKGLHPKGLRLVLGRRYHSLSLTNKHKPELLLSLVYTPIGKIELEMLHRQNQSRLEA